MEEKALNDRQRFLNTMLFGDIDRLPRWEWAFRSDTTARWHAEGLPAEVPDRTGWVEYFGLDRGAGYANQSMAEKVGVNWHPIPGFEGEVIEEDERTIMRKNLWGAMARYSKESASIPQYLSFGVRTREDWVRIKSHWDPADPTRYPTDWEERKARWNNRTYPISLFTYGWYGLLRELFGVEELSIAFYEDAALIDEICEFWADFLVELFERALTEASVDYVLFWEDLAFKTAPLVSPRHFRRFFLPHYKRVTSHFRRKGVRLFMVDSDGAIDDIIPLWLEAGISILGPFEVSAGMDVVKVRQTYGKDLAIVGGIDKMEIAKGRFAIEAEVLRCVKPFLGSGGYIPTCDHCPIPEISFSDYRYYREFLRKVCEE